MTGRGRRPRAARAGDAAPRDPRHLGQSHLPGTGSAPLGYDDRMAQRDPHDVLGVDRGASQATVKAAWRRLAREHHPDLAADSATRRDATRRMAEINAAYQALRSGRRRTSRHARPGCRGGRRAGSGRGTLRPEAPRPSGPPPPPPTRPVTARLDTTDLFRPRNATTTPAGGGFRHRPRPPMHLRRATWGQAEEPRASDPTGPLHRVRARRAARRPLPDLDAALATRIVFGKFHGRTLGEIAALEPTYLQWVERTITRDPDLVAAARVVLDLPASPPPSPAIGPRTRRSSRLRRAPSRRMPCHPVPARRRPLPCPALRLRPAWRARPCAGGANKSGDADRRPREGATRGSAG